MSEPAREMEHDEVVGRLVALAPQLDLKQIASAFVAGLTSAPERFRRPLLSAGWAILMPPHALAPSGGDMNYKCAVCGLNERATLSERGKAWQKAHVALLDLEDFLEGPRPQPNEADWACFAAMLDAVEAVPHEGRASDLVKRWSKVVPRTNVGKRQTLIETLAHAGVLETRDHPGMLSRWVNFWELEERPSSSGDMGPPAAWWRGSDGIGSAILAELFSLSRESHSDAPSRTVELGPSHIPKPKGGPKGSHAIDVLPGDVLAIRMYGRCIAAVVIGRHIDGKRPLPLLEFYDASWSDWPDLAQLAQASARRVGPFRTAPRWRRELLVPDGLELFGEVRRLARDQPPPCTDAPSTDDLYRVVAPRNVGYLFRGLVGTARRAD